MSNANREGVALRVLIVSVGLLLLAGIMSWAWGRRAVEDRAESLVGGASSVLSSSSGRGATVTTRVGLEVGGVSELILTVRDARGRELAGVLSWRAGLDPVALHDPMLMFSGKRKGGVRQARVDGRHRVSDVPAGSWLWMRFAELEDPSRSWYRRIRLVRGRQSEEWVVDRKARGIHVFVWNESLTGPAELSEISILGGDMHSGAPVSPVAGSRTDRHGYAYVGGLPAGRYLVVGPGAGRKDVFPHCTQVIVPARAPVAEVLCVVAAREEAREVAVTVEGRLAGPRTSRFPGRLYLARMDDGSGSAYPLRDSISHGVRRHVARVPEGSYQVRSNPVGSLEVDPAGETVVVGSSGGSCAVSVKRAVASTLVELVGIDESAFPVSVHPRRFDDAVVGEREDLVFLGDYRWSRASRQVPRVPYRCRLVIRGRGRSYLSDGGPLEIEGPRCVVSVRPAVRMEVLWGGKHARLPRAAYLRITSSMGKKKEEISIWLRKTLIRDGAALQPAFASSTVVPEGQTTIECISAAGGTFWRRTETLVGPEKMLRIRKE